MAELLEEDDSDFGYEEDRPIRAEDQVYRTLEEYNAILAHDPEEDGPEMDLDIRDLGIPGFHADEDEIEEITPSVR